MPNKVSVPQGSRATRRSSRAAALAVLVVVASSASISYSAAAHLTTRVAAVTHPRCAPTGTKGIASRGGGRVDVFDSLDQILPEERQRGGSRETACQARNGFASFQLEVTAPASVGLSDVSMSASSLTGSRGAEIPHADVRLYREAYTTISRASNGELSHVVPRSSKGTCLRDCQFPDELVPDVDAIFHQKRKAFPFNVPRDQDRAVWVDIQVPGGQKPGAYTGSIHIKRSSKTVAVVPIRLQVLNATLPSTSSVGGAFFLSPGGRVPAAGSSAAKSQPTYSSYAELGLDDRVSIVSDSALSQKELTDVDGPLLTGSDTRTLLKGAELTAFPISNGFSSGQVAYYKTALTNLGLAGRASGYCDEVTPADCANSYVDGAFTTWTDLPLTPIDLPNEGWPDPKSGSVVPDALAGRVTTPIVLAQLLDPTSYYYNNFYKGVRGSRMPSLRQWRADATGRQAWVYTTCYSGGCDAKYSTASENSGWPSYGIDQVASEQTAMGWQIFSYGLNGEFYDDTTSCLSPSQCGGSEYHAGVNGDETLFYKYSKQKIGGTTPVPVESIRLKRIRDGRQDYELFKLAAAKSKGMATSAHSIASSVFPAMSQSAVSDAVFDRGRQKLIDLFE